MGFILLSAAFQDEQHQSSWKTSACGVTGPLCAVLAYEGLAEASSIDAKSVKDGCQDAHGGVFCDDWGASVTACCSYGLVAQPNLK